ncbi:eukaryotic translation initiation factor 2-alpha kinase-like isoform X1 [Vanessa cardui]|uniref:eukaryotic translation initiation factor 2-alpha kinase-like isoform X1 n=1 Tax=Vanessa cardui TaxID=171605 RepID=UPI001F141B98|nr:eukaryotic translation initiation factor 2-alpha kinase-like isoform X1 [Vanessa cardui]
MSNWYWRVIALKAAFVLTCFVSYIRTDDNIQKLPFCNPHAAKDTAFNDLIIVSTLDGRLTAFSSENGIKAWSLETQPLLSSNLHHVELTSGGKWVRLVPSLRGTLFSLSGDAIEPLPFDAEELLSSSFKYSDDLVIAGARETLWVGLDAHTGTVIYECSSSGCNSEQQTATAGRDIIVLRRHSNTVRALDPRSGTEKWNFSVAEHHLALSRRECFVAGAARRALAVGVSLPDGVVLVRAPDSRATLWQHKLEAPVAGMWRLQDGSLENMDVLWEAARALADSSTQNTPSLYLGVHNTQLYIQESVLYAQKIETSVSTKPVPWKLKQSMPLIADGSTAVSQPVEDPRTLAVITLHGNSGRTDNHGFFLYLQETCDQAVQVTEDSIEGPEIVLPNNSDDQPNHHHVHVHVYSLWFWWKEVLLIAISSALLMNLMIWPRFFAPKLRPPTPLPMNQEYIVVERHYERPPSNNNTEYSGRYENDFTPLQCLGKGGFGVVFEARNNIDHCSYAVKRITLPKRASRRERVLREVRALAKLEHEHIVRYFNAWLEEPPARWQEQRDAHWLRELGGISVAMSEDYTSPTPASPAPEKSPTKGDSVMLNLHKSIDECVDALDYEKKLSEPRRHRSLSCNDSFSIIFDENASKDPHSTTETPKLSDVTPSTLSKHNGSGDNDDSFIVFANTGDPSSGLSEARKEVSNKILEKIKECDTFQDSQSYNKKKKKGHTRHWSLDMCVRSPDEGASGSKMYLYIQMQLCRRDSLHDWLRNNRTWESRRDQVKTLFSQIVSAVEYVHLAGLIHRDLKPSNIFFAPDGKVKVGDFGLVTAMTDNSQDGPAEELDVHARHTHRVGTHLYMSPEQLLGRPYSYKVDIYSLGLVLFELLHPFGTESERVACLMRVRNGHYPHNFQQNYPNETEVLKLMLSDEPKERPTASGVRARAPLYQNTDQQWHFTLPTLISC